MAAPKVSKVDTKAGNPNYVNPNQPNPQLIVWQPAPLGGGQPLQKGPNDAPAGK